MTVSGEKPPAQERLDSMYLEENKTPDESWFNKKFLGELEENPAHSDMGAMIREYIDPDNPLGESKLRRIFDLGSARSSYVKEPVPGKDEPDE